MCCELVNGSDGCSIEYAKVIHQITLEELNVAGDESVLALAMKVNNKVRLIDNASLAY